METFIFYLFGFYSFRLCILVALMKQHRIRHMLATQCLLDQVNFEIVLGLIPIIDEVFRLENVFQQKLSLHILTAY